MVDYEKLKDENAQLKEIAGIKELYPDFEVMPAQVVSRDASDRASSFIIDRGSLHGIAAVSYTHLDVYKRQRLYYTKRKQDAQKNAPLNGGSII